MTVPPAPSRRELLAATAGVAGGFAGCLGDRADPDPQTTSDDGSTERTADPATSDDRSTERTADPATAASCDARDDPWRAIDESQTVPATTIEPAPGDLPRIEFPHARYFCRDPGAPDDCLERMTDVRVVSSRAVGADAPLSMTPSTDRLELPGTLACTVTNRTTEPFLANFHARQLWKRVDGRWYHIYPHAYLQPAMSLPPGDRLRYCLHLDNDSYRDEHLHTLHPDQHDRTRNADGGDADSGAGGSGERGWTRWDQVIPALGGGEYAFVLFGDIAPPDEVDETPRTGVAARFTLGGDPIELTTSGHVEDVTVDDGRVTAHWTYNDGEWASGDGRFTLRRVDAVDRPRPLITEQVVRLCGGDSPVRDALALARRHDVDEVALEGRSDGYPAFGCPDYPLAYDGRLYEVESETTDRSD